MKTTLMKQLSDARPAHLDPAAPADPAVRARELAAAFGGPRHERGVTGPAASRRRARPAFQLGVAVAAAASVAAAAAIVVAGHGPAAQPGPQAESARQILLTAARSAASAPATSGTYWFTDYRTGTDYVIHGRSRPYVVQALAGRRDWIKANSPQRTAQQTKSGQAGPGTVHYWAVRSLGGAAG